MSLPEDAAPKEKKSDWHRPVMRGFNFRLTRPARTDTFRVGPYLGGRMCPGCSGLLWLEPSH